MIQHLADVRQRHHLTVVVLSNESRDLENTRLCVEIASDLERSGLLRMGPPETRDRLAAAGPGT